MVGINGTHGHNGALNGTDMHPAAAYLADAYYTDAVSVQQAATPVSGPTDGDSTGPTQDGSDGGLGNEQQRLEAELAVARQRIAAANARAAAHDEAVRAGLRAELLVAQQTLAEMEQRHDETIARLRADTQLEVDRILAAGRDRAGTAATPATAATPLTSAATAAAEVRHG